MASIRRLGARALPAGWSALLLVVVALSLAQGPHGLRRESRAGERVTYALDHWPWPLLDGASLAFTDRADSADRVRLEGFVWQGAPGAARWRLIHSGGVEVLVDGRRVFEAPLPAPGTPGASVALRVDEFDVAWTGCSLGLTVAVHGGIERLGSHRRLHVELQERGPRGHWRRIPTSRLHASEPVPGVARRDVVLGQLENGARIGLLLCSLALAVRALRRRARRAPRVFWVAAGAATLALAVRVLVLLERSTGDPNFWSPSLLADNYVMMARATLSGTSAVQGSYFSPGNTWWLMGVSRVLGPSLWVLHGANVVVSALGVGALCAATANWMRTSGGIVAGLLAALLPPLVFYQTTLHIAAIGSALMAWVPLALIGCASGGARTVLACGMLLGANALTRPTALVLLPVFAVAIAWKWRAYWRTALRRIALVGVGAAIVVLPQTLLNARSPFPSLISNNGGANLLIGNNRDSSGSFDTPDAYRAALSWTAMTGMSVVAAAWREVRLEPLRAAELQLMKVGRLFDPDEGRGVLTYRVDGLAASSTLRRLSCSGRFELTALWWPALAGLLLTLRSRSPRAGPMRGLAALAVAYAAATVAFIVEGRLRAPLTPLLVPLAALGLGELGSHFKRPAYWLPAWLVAGALLLGGTWSVEHLPRKRFVEALPAAATPLAIDAAPGLQLIGHRDAGSNARRRGFLYWTLFWKKTEAASSARPVVLRLVDEATGRELAKRSLVPGTVTYPRANSATWPVGAILGESVYFRLTRETPAHLRLEVLPHSVDDDGLKDGTVTTFHVTEDAVDLRPGFGPVPR